MITYFIDSSGIVKRFSAARNEGLAVENPNWHPEHEEADCG